MDFEFQLIGIGDEAIAKDVVEVAVGIDQTDGAQFVGADKIAQFARFLSGVTAGVDDNTFFSVVVEHIGVFLEGIASKSGNKSHIFSVDKFNISNCGAV